MKPSPIWALALTAALGASAGHAAPVAGTDPSAPKASPGQSAVAAKKPFTSAPAAAAKGALDAKDMAGALKMIGKPGAFRGTVSAVYSPKSHGVVILNFDPDFRQALTAIVRPAAYAKLPDLSALKGRHVLVSGKFEAYKDKPEIEITDPSQIRLLP